MKQTRLLSLILIMLSAPLHADRLMEIMQGYDAKTMSVAEMDSILENESGNAKGERYRLEHKNKQKLFRHSFFADYYLIDTQKNDTIPLSDVPVRDAAMSPNGKYVVSRVALSGV